MEIEYDNREPRVKISDYPIGTVFKFDGVVYMKIALTRTSLNNYGFVSLETGLRPLEPSHRDIEYGSVEILNAKLYVTKA